MVKYCPNCGEQLEDDGVFCTKCGSKVCESESGSKTITRENINESMGKLNDHIDRVSNEFSDSFSDLFSMYRIEMVDDEEIISRAEIHPGLCMCRYCLSVLHLF